MRRFGILRAPARRRGTIFGESASSFSLSSSGTAGFTAAAATGRWRIGAGWPVRSSTLLRSRLSFQEGIDAIGDALQRLRRVEKQLALVVPEWSMAPVVEAYQAMRGASFLVAVTFAAEIGDVRRFDTPRQLMSFLGLVPAESSTGNTVRRMGLTLAGNRRARRALVEAAWTYRYPARVSETLRARLEGLPKPVRDIAWKAQVRLCARYRRLSATGKKPPVVVAAIAREMAAFLWAIGREVAPT
jgi:transposase